MAYAGVSVGSIKLLPRIPICTVPIDMSPISPFQMSLSADGVVECSADDGDGDEPERDRPDARVA
jgi:hypothetical protein